MRSLNGWRTVRRPGILCASSCETNESAVADVEVDVAGHGPPVLIFHGMPGSRIDARFWSTAAAELGVNAQFVAFDRPGYGRSAAQPGRTLRTVAEEAKKIVDGRVRLLAVSAGCPFALATAELMGARAESVTIISGLGPVAYGHGRDFDVMRRPEPEVRAWAEALIAETPQPARTGVAAVDVFLESLAEGMRSPEGIVEDIMTIREQWTTDLGAITAAVRLFHAVDDENAPIEGARFLAESITGAELIEWPNGGHMAAAAHTAEILASVMA
jgi:pimeloyl-ACP methyl ester carboxylesterase